MSKMISSVLMNIYGALIVYSVFFSSSNSCHAFDRKPKKHGKVSRKESHVSLLCRKEWGETFPLFLLKVLRQPLFHDRLSVQNQRNKTTKIEGKTVDQTRRVMQ